MADGNGNDTSKATALATTSERFVALVQRQFTAELGDTLAWTDYQKRLAQHLFLKVDAQLRYLESRRSNDRQTPYTWANVNLQKLALDGVHRIGLGLDALIPNHISPVPYWNNSAKKYDVDLRIGYVGKDYCHRKFAVEEPVDIIYHLVHETDHFRPIMKSLANEVEGYEFEIRQPFDRGKVVGGFGYVMYADPKKNRLVLVSQRDFQKAEAAAGSREFWSDEKWRLEMMYKTVVHRTTSKIALDPTKVNAKSYAYVEAQERETEVAEEMAMEANREVIDVDVTDVEQPRQVERSESSDSEEQGQEQPTQTATPEPETKGSSKRTRPAKEEPLDLGAQPDPGF
jgi:recombination protein RecT